MAAVSTFWCAHLRLLTRTMMVVIHQREPLYPVALGLPVSPVWLRFAVVPARAEELRRFLLYEQCREGICRRGIAFPGLN